jgi:ATP-binding protein involved in chromosome partitioning
MYGPNVPIMLGLKTQLETDGKKMLPAERYGLQVISMGFLTQDDAPSSGAGRCCTARFSSSSAIPPGTTWTI